jgi:hypothetical protein
MILSGSHMAMSGANAHHDGQRHPRRRAGRQNRRPVDVGRDVLDALKDVSRPAD